MATEILEHEYGGNGKSIQFHSNTTYENFVGGLSPTQTSSDLGLRFAPKFGFLMSAAAEALRFPHRKYLLHIDEINRADIGKVLGEVLFLLEPNEPNRQVRLPYDFGEPFGDRFSIPQNLHILGTMNSADRSIAVTDIAVRRRFAFLFLWPNPRVLNNRELACEQMTNAFRDLLSIFVEHASDESFVYVPGHSYFLEADANEAKRSLRTNLLPLLEEYLAQGYVGGFADSIQANIQAQLAS